MIKWSAVAQAVGLYRHPTARAWSRPTATCLALPGRAPPPRRHDLPMSLLRSARNGSFATGSVRTGSVWCSSTSSCARLPSRAQRADRHLTAALDEYVKPAFGIHPVAECPVYHLPGVVVHPTWHPGAHHVLPTGRCALEDVQAATSFRPMYFIHPK